MSKDNILQKYKLEHHSGWWTTPIPMRCISLKERGHKTEILVSTPPSDDEHYHNMAIRTPHALHEFPYSFMSHKRVDNLIDNYVTAIAEWDSNRRGLDVQVGKLAHLRLKRPDSVRFTQKHYFNLLYGMMNTGMQLNANEAVVYRLEWMMNHIIIPALSDEEIVNDLYDVFGPRDGRFLALLTIDELVDIFDEMSPETKRKVMKVKLLNPRYINAGEHLPF